MTRQRRPLIVHPVDDSAPPRAGLAWAAAVAARFGADLDVVHPMGDADEILEKRSGHEAPVRREVRLAARSGDPVEVVDGYATEANAALIVIDSAYGHSGVWQGPGTIARSLGGRAASPVLVIPSGAGEPPDLAGQAGPVVCAVDYSPASMNALSAAAILARTTGAQLHLLHVLDGFPGRSIYSGAGAMRVQAEFDALVKRNRSRLRRLLSARGFGPDDVRTAVESGEPHRRIVALAAATRASAIVMGVAPRDAVKEFVDGATVTPVIRRAASPVLLVSSTVGTAALSLLTAGGHPWTHQRQAAEASTEPGRPATPQLWPGKCVTTVGPRKWTSSTRAR